MLTRGTRIKLIAFLLTGVAFLAYTAARYADLGRYLGMQGYYVVHLNLANSGGIFPNADVTYRGVSVGRVAALRLTATGVQADLNINDNAPPIPAHLQAAVANLSAVGEEYIDLRPQTSQGPYLASGSVISERDTQLPLPVTSLLTSVNTLATSLPLNSLRSVMNALGTGLNAQGTNLQGLVDGQSALVHSAYLAIPQTTILIQDSRTVLGTQVAETSALNSFGSNASLLAQSLKGSNASLNQLIIEAPQTAAQVSRLLTDSNPALGILIANLLTTSEVSMTRGNALQELLSALPAGIAAGSTAINNKGATFGLALTFFNPLPCMAGYGGTVFRNGLNTSPGPPLNTNASCTEPPSQGDVRGAAHAPRGGPVPPPADPGLAGLLGLTP
ncbi:MAG TPA: MlaD family protein [Streptosporangiaceae bacterium]|nr:MlaD family protein [Streptosporangiaceae bacterium]